MSMMDEDEYKVFRMIGFTTDEIQTIDWVLDQMLGYFIIASSRATVKYGSRGHIIIMITKKLLECLGGE